MALLNRALMTLGLGSCEVDTLLDKEQFLPGERVSAWVKIQGGKVGQKVRGVYFSLHCSYEQMEEGQMQQQQVELAHFQLPLSLTVDAGEQVKVPIEFVLPEFTPLTLGKTKVWLATGLDIKQAIDPKDNDYFDVLPSPLVASLFERLKEIGFDQSWVHTEAISVTAKVHTPYLQMFHYKPKQGEFFDRIEELELALVPTATGICLHTEVTRTGRGMAAAVSRIMADGGERQKALLTPELVEQLPDRLRELIVD